MVEKIGEQLGNHSEVRGCSLWNKNAAERDVILSWGLMIDVSVLCASKGNQEYQIGVWPSTTAQIDTLVGKVENHCSKTERKRTEDSV